MGNLKIFTCSCHGEGVSIEKSDNNEIFLSLWERGFKPKMSLLDRIKYCWYVLTSGYAWADNVILDDKTAEKLATGLMILAETEYEEEKIGLPKGKRKK